ncbi:sulfite exporter TauE/SafE family protein [Pseudoprimorskyibacter insulae]|nr:sulfite exporter TauE/SafE family protein [Pseudoprimorskyibacter insulae]
MLALQIEGLAFILLAVFAAGVVYGFAGFGAALIFMPVASRFIPVEMAIGAFALGGLASAATVLPKTLPLVQRRPMAIMLGAAIVSVSLGILVLRHSDVVALRWAVIAVCTITLIALVSGWRHATPPTSRNRALLGAATGFVGGTTGLTGPVLVLFQLSSRDSVERSRATLATFLTLLSILMIPLMAVQGALPGHAVALGLLLLPPYALGCWIGARMFRPDREYLYRTVAYGLIGCAILLGLPIWH